MLPVATTDDLGAIKVGKGLTVGSDGTLSATGGSGGGVQAGDPTQPIGLGVKDGASNTYMRSDAAPALDQGIAPTWTSMHTFGKGLAFGSGENAELLENGVVLSDSSLNYAVQANHTHCFYINKIAVATIDNPLDPKNDNSLIGKAYLQTCVSNLRYIALGSPRLSASAGTNSIAIGNAASAGASALAVGSDALALGEQSIALGSFTNSNASGGVAVGGMAIAGASGTTALGSFAKATGEQSVAIGYDASVSASNSVALGGKTTCDQANAVGVGNRRIVDVADGTNPSDAATVNQLKSVTSQYEALLAEQERKLAEMKADHASLRTELDALKKGISR